MRPLFETVTDLAAGADVLRARSYGMIETRQGRFVRLVYRPWPRRVTWLGARVVGEWRRGFAPGDVCRLYFNRPRRFPQFLSVVFVLSGREASFATFRAAVTTLDEVARLVGSDALLCDASNARISDRLLARWGWEPHAPSAWHRNFIKRFEPRAAETVTRPPAGWLPEPAELADALPSA